MFNDKLFNLIGGHVCCMSLSEFVKEISIKVDVLSVRELNHNLNMDSAMSLLPVAVVITFFFNCLHTKSLLVTQFLKPDTQTPEPHTKSVKPNANSQPLIVFYFLNHFLQNTTHFSMQHTKI